MFVRLQWLIPPKISNLRRGYEAPFLVRPGRLPPWQGLSERRLGYRDRSPVVAGPRDPSQNVHALQCVSSVYFLINTCLTGLRSSGILSREVSVCIIIGLTARRGGERKGKEEVESEYVWGAC